VEVTSPEELGEGSLSLPVRLGDTSAKHIILLTLLQNHEKKISEMVRPIKIKIIVNFLTQIYQF
jgi:hypothetical protein